MAKDYMIKWLNDAHAMEKSLIKTLEAQSKDAEDYPDIKKRIDQHIEESKRHAELIEENMAMMDEKPSGLKSAGGTMMGMMQGATMGAAEDSIVKSAIADYASEHFEIASYKAMRHFAEQTGHGHIVKMCDEILKDEESMAKFLEEKLPETIKAFSANEEVYEASRMQPAFGEKIEGQEK